MVYISNSVDKTKWSWRTPLPSPYLPPPLPSPTSHPPSPPPTSLVREVGGFLYAAYYIWFDETKAIL